MQLAELQAEVAELKFDRSKWKPTKFGEVVACVDKTCRNPAEVGLTRIVGLDNLDPGAEGYPIVRESRDAQLDVVMSNSFGFGGTNAALVFARA